MKNIRRRLKRITQIETEEQTRDLTYRAVLIRVISVHLWRMFFSICATLARFLVADWLCIITMPY